MNGIAVTGIILNGDTGAVYPFPALSSGEVPAPRTRWEAVHRLSVATLAHTVRRHPQEVLLVRLVRAWHSAQASISLFPGEILLHPDRRPLLRPGPVKGMELLAAGPASPFA